MYWYDCAVIRTAVLSILVDGILDYTTVFCTHFILLFRSFHFALFLKSHFINSSLISRSFVEGIPLTTTNVELDFIFTLDLPWWRMLRDNNFILTESSIGEVLHMRGRLRIRNASHWETLIIHCLHSTAVGIHENRHTRLVVKKWTSTEGGAGMASARTGKLEGRNHRRILKSKVGRRGIKQFGRPMRETERN